MNTERPHPPPRFALPGWHVLAGIALFILFYLYSLYAVNLSLPDLYRGFPHMLQLLGEMIPPDLSRFGSVVRSVLATFQMAVVGAGLGIVFSFFLSIFAAKNLSPSPVFYHAARWLIALFRTIPDLVWAIFFVATVGLGAFAGTLTIIVDTIGFCGRFFAEAMEEVDAGPQEALVSIGANRAGIIFSAVVPAALPSFINSSLFSLEKAIRSSVVLGLVGAGGIGIELKVAMDMFLYAEAAAIILSVFVLVLAVERISSWVRNTFL
jgi:phosphonate transport system permease protein